MHITWRQIEIFRAVARLGNITRAASEMGLSQSAASSALAELESQLGVQLFDRVGRQVVLNGNGRDFLPRAVDVLQQTQDLANHFQAGQSGRLQIAASLTVGNYVLPAVLAQLLAKAPQLHVEAQIVNSRSVVAQLLECRIDLGMIEAAYRDPLLVTEPWLDDELVVYARTDHPLASAAPDLAKLAQCRWLMRERGSGVRRIMEDVLSPALGGMRIMLELGSGEAIREAVRHGLGVACASRRELGRELDRGELCILPTPGIRLLRQFHLAWHAERRLSANAECLRACCRAWRDDGLSFPVRC
jgi:DNA-binding transcriptional LysR family regulator